MHSKLVISDSEEIVEPQLHDSRLTGVQLLPHGAVRIVFEKADGVGCSLLLQEVERLRVDDFREGNIVLDVTASLIHLAMAEDVARAYAVKDVNNSDFQRILKELISGNRLLLEVNPSFGCHLVSVCGSVLVEI